jgi:hypothetical protein
VFFDKGDPPAASYTRATGAHLAEGHVSGLLEESYGWVIRAPQGLRTFRPGIKENDLGSIESVLGEQGLQRSGGSLSLVADDQDD